MRDSDRVRALVAIADLQTHLTRHLSTAIRTKLATATAKPQLQGTDYNGSSTTSIGGHSDPTGSAIDAAGTRTQRAIDDIAAWDQQLHDAWSKLDSLWSSVNYVLAEPIAPEPRPTQKALIGCRSCARLTKPDGTKVFELVDAPRFTEWCRNCGQWRTSHGRVPPLGVIKAWHEGRRLTSKIVADALADEQTQAKAG